MNLDAYDAILRAVVKPLAGDPSRSGVDYGFVVGKLAALEDLVTKLGGADVAPMNEDERLAFFINAYNLVVLTAVGRWRKQDARAGRPSVRDVEGFFDRVEHTIAGERLTLNALEERKLRLLDPKTQAAKDPRVHFALSKASKDSAPLAAKAYRAKTLRATLEAQTRAFLPRPGEVAVDEASKRIVVVQLFEWYATDFGGEAGARAFLAKYVPALAPKLGDEVYDLDFRPYDWALNVA